MSDKSKGYKEPHVGRYLIYGLLDPRDNSLRYIGKTHKRRENRLEEHIEDSLNGSTVPVHVWIRKLLDQELEPLIFVLKRVESSENWREKEKQEISYWNSFSFAELPYVHAPQTKKSKATRIQKINLLNVQHCG